MSRACDVRIICQHALERMFEEWYVLSLSSTELDDLVLIPLYVHDDFVTLVKH